MTDYFLAPALGELRDELDSEFPKRDKTSDGWIGDASHAARKSDHNPCWSCSGRSEGIVRALDVDNNGKPGEVTPLVRALLAATIGDPRVWYVIYNRVIYSRTNGWTPHAYTGENPHDKHVHVSLNGANGVAGDPGNFDTSPWLTDPEPEPAHPEHIGASLDHAIADVRRALRYHRRKGHTARVNALAKDLRELKETRRLFP